jgi:hypothetical protein
LRVFENRELRGKVEHLYSLLCIVKVIMSRSMGWAGHVEHTEEMRNAYKIVVGTTERKKPFGRCSYICKDIIKVDLNEIVHEGFDWVHLAQDRGGLF